MWRSKMAARWRGEDGALNTGGSAYLSGNTPAELVLCGGDVGGVDMDTQSCVDHSILAIFEDSTVASEGKIGAEEESETLLSALTEMLDSVEDDDQTLSPFDTLPDTKLLNHAELRDTSVELSLAHRLRPRLKPPSVTFTIKSDGEKDQESKEEKNNLSQIFKKQSQMLFQPKTKKAEAEVEVFTSTSLVSLVRIMHPYCLKLHVEEEGDKVGKNRTIFSQEEVWKYERPTEESDEEINVVSDDEAPAKDTKEEDEGDGKRDNGLKSVLLNRNSPRASASREKKRVSFGSVQVASFDDSVEEKPNEKNLTSGHTSQTEPLNSRKALESPAGSALEPPSSEMSCTKTEVQTPKGETKAKSLSLQQYRQLRQKRLPLVEQQGNYTTKWPSVSEPPKELTPILCLQGQKHPSYRSKTTRHYPEMHKLNYKTSSHRVPPNPSEAKPSARRGLKRPRTESKVVSPASALPDFTANPNITVSESKKSPAKKPTLLNSDPPNPVLLPLPVPQTASPSKGEFSSRDSSLHEIQNESSAAALQRQTFSSEPKPQMSSQNTDRVTLIQEMKFTETPPDVSSVSPTEAQSVPECKKPQPQKYNPTKETNLPPKIIPSPSPDSVRPIKRPSSPPPSLVDSPTSVQKELPEEPASPETTCKGQIAAVDSGIEAPDLTSLLEQFEETQAKEEIICDKETKPGLSDLCRAQPVVSDKISRFQPSMEPTASLSTSETPATQNTLRNLPDIQTLEGVDIPEPLCPEIILSSRQEWPARRKNPPAKAIQIIDPRPLPPRRTHTEPPAAQTSSHMYLHISSDHDYCGLMDHSNVSSSQRNRVKDVSTTTAELQVTTQDSAAASESKKQISTGQTKSEQTWIRSEKEPSTEEALQFSEEKSGFSENKKPQCTLPTPPPSPPVRGRDTRRYRRRSPRSDSSSSSCSSSSSSSSSSASRSPKRRRLRHKRSESSSCSSSPSYSVSRSPPRRYRLSYSRSRYSRSRSRSWSHSRSPSQSRSPSPPMCRRRWGDVCSSRESRRLRREHEIRIQKLKAIDERRVVYVGRIRRTMTHDELRERFTQFGEVECVSLHFRDRGDHYGFVTFYNMDDAFAAIDNGSKLRKPDELPFDICFGGRRQFCNTDYADLDANRDAEPSPSKSRFEDLDFDSLLKQAQRGLKR